MENGSSPSPVGHRTRAYPCLWGAACVLFLLCADPGQSWAGLPMVSEALNRTGNVISGMSEPEQQNKQVWGFFSVFASSKIPTRSLVTEYQTQPWKHVRWAKALGLAASIENDSVSCLKTRHLIIWSYIVLTPHATGLMEHFSYLLRRSKAKPSNTTAMRNLHALYQSSVSTS